MRRLPVLVFNEPDEATRAPEPVLSGLNTTALHASPSILTSRSLSRSTAMQRRLFAPAFQRNRECYGCGIDLNRLGIGFLTAKRHHCRNCGESFCFDCVKWRAYVHFPEYEGHKQRVCEACYNELHAKASTPVLSSRRDAIVAAANQTNEVNGQPKNTFAKEFRYEVSKVECVAHFSSEGAVCYDSNPEFMLDIRTSTGASYKIWKTQNDFGSLKSTLEAQCRLQQKQSLFHLNQVNYLEMADLKVSLASSSFSRSFWKIYNKLDLQDLSHQYQLYLNQFPQYTESLYKSKELDEFLQLSTHQQCLHPIAPPSHPAVLPSRPIERLKLQQLEVVVYAMLEEVFELNAINVLRRNFLAITKKFARFAVHGSVERWIKQTYPKLTTTKNLAKCIKYIRQSVWPNGEFLQEVEQDEAFYSEQSKAQRYDQAKALIMECLPSACGSILGEQACRNGCCKVYELLQCKLLLKNLLFCWVDLLLQKVFPNLQLGSTE